MLTFIAVVFTVVSRIGNFAAMRTSNIFSGFSRGTHCGFLLVSERNPNFPWFLVRQAGQTSEKDFVTNV
jgi:hypothetical protein